MIKKIDDAANMWNKTKDPKYKNLWYKLIKEFVDVQNADNINTSVRWDTTQREISTGKTNGSP